MISTTSPNSYSPTGPFERRASIFSPPRSPQIQQGSSHSYPMWNGTEPSITIYLNKFNQISGVSYYKRPQLSFDFTTKKLLMQALNVQQAEITRQQKNTQILEDKIKALNLENTALKQVLIETAKDNAVLQKIATQHFDDSLETDFEDLSPSSFLEATRKIREIDHKRIQDYKTKFEEQLKTQERKHKQELALLQAQIREKSAIESEQRTSKLQAVTKMLNELKEGFSRNMQFSETLEAIKELD